MPRWIPLSVLLMTLVTSDALATAIPSFLPGTTIRPYQVRSKYLGPGRPVARPKFAEVDVHFRGQGRPPGGRTIGIVEVSTTNRNVSIQNLIEGAQIQARRFGGDALVDVTFLPMSGDHEKRVLRASIVTVR